MLRRVGFAYRQHLKQTVGILTGYSYISVSFVRSVHQSVCAQCSTATAKAYQHSPHHFKPSGDQNIDVPFSSGKKPGMGVLRVPNKSVSSQEEFHPQLPAELLFMINTLFARTMDKDAILKTARSSPILLEHLLDREKARRLAEDMTRTHFPQWSHRVLDLAHELGCQLKQNTYECSAHHLAMAKHWNLVCSMVSLGQRHTSRTTVRLLNWRARALVEMQHYMALEGILGECERQHLKPDRRTFHLLISGHIRNHNLSKAKECLQHMEAAGIPADPSTHALIATVYRTLGADPQVQNRALEALPYVHSGIATAVLNSLMQMRIDAHDFPGALQVLSLFDQGQGSTTVTPASRANSILNDGKEPRNPLLVDRTSSRQRPIPPDAETFSILINHMATQHDLPGALRILNRMAAAGVPPNAGTVVSLIHVHFATGDEGTAIRMVAEMCGEHKAHIFSPLLPVSARAALPLAVAGISPTIQVFNALLRGILATRGLNGCFVILRIMRANGIEPSAATLEILISHLGKVEHARPRMLLRILRNISSTAIRPNLRHMHVIFNSVLRHEKYLLHGSGWNVTAAKFSSRRHDKSQYPENRISGIADSFDPTAGIEFPRKWSYRSIVRPIMQSLSSRGVRSDGATIALRIRHDAVMKSDLETAREVFHTLLARGMHPNEYHFSALMEGYAQAGDLDTAESVLQSAVRAGVRPNVVMFTILIVGHARQGNPDLATRAFQRMVSTGIQPDVPSIDAVSSAFFAVGAYAMARRVLSSLWLHISPFPQELRGASLKELARNFRLLHGNHHGAQKLLTKQQRLMLHWKLKGLVDSWKSSSQPGLKRRRFGTKSSSFVSRISLESQKVP